MLKSIFATAAVLLVMGVSTANAQMADRQVEHPAPGNRSSSDALSMTREMTNRLQLNEAQFVKLLPINRTKLSSINSINHMYKADEATRTQKLQELEAQYEQECSRILTPSQLSQLQQQNGRPVTAPANSGNGVG